ncbi:MAG: DUF177 domain-containing protein [Fimbriimonadaceae bacterium]|nr:DUF177 domain-containing protein [Chitinophagales bacterium]
MKVKELREYIIPFLGLKNGVHHFNYEIDTTFFTHFEASLVHESKLFADVTLDKKERLFILNFDISGTIKAECDRCGQEFDMPIHGNHSIFVKIGDKREEDENNEEVIWIDEVESSLNIAEMLYEFIHLSIPIKKNHLDNPDGTAGCDPEILKHIGEHQEANNIDPRWEILNKLNKN